MCITTNACAYNIFSLLICFCVRVDRPLAVRVQNLFFRMSLYEMATGKENKGSAINFSNWKQFRNLHTRPIQGTITAGLRASLYQHRNVVSLLPKCKLYSPRTQTATSCKFKGGKSMFDTGRIFGKAMRIFNGRPVSTLGDDSRQKRPLGRLRWRYTFNKTLKFLYGATTGSYCGL